MATLGSLAVNIVARTDRFTKGIGKALSQTERFRKGLGKATKTVAGLTTGLVAAGTTGFLALANSQRDALDLVGKTSDKLGIQTERLIGLSHAAEQNGISQNTMFMAMQRSTRRIAEAAQGTGEAVKALDELGLSAVALNRLSPDQQLGKIADAMNKVEGQSDKVRLAMKLFDSEGVAMVNMLRLGTDGLRKMDREAKKLGISFSRDKIARVEAFNDEMDRLSKSVGGLASGFVIEVAPTAIKWVKDLTDAVHGLKYVKLPGTDGSKDYLEYIPLYALNKEGTDLNKWAQDNFYSKFFEQNAGGKLSVAEQAAADKRVADSLAMTDQQSAELDRRIELSQQDSPLWNATGGLFSEAKSKFDSVVDKAFDNAPGLAEQFGKGVNDLFDKAAKRIEQGNEANSFMDAFKTPAERIKDQLNKAKDLFSEGLINQGQFNKVLDSLTGQTNALMPALASGPQFSSAALRGSAEARSAVLRGNRDTPIMKVAKINEKQLEEVKGLREDLKEAKKGDMAVKPF